MQGQRRSAAARRGKPRRFFTTRWHAGGRGRVPAEAAFGGSATPSSCGELRFADFAATDALYLAEVLQHLGDHASSRQCLRSACFVSTSAKWDYHESVVVRVLRLAAFVGVKENLDEYKALLTDLRDSWRSNGPTEKLDAFPELMDTMLINRGCRDVAAHDCAAQWSGPRF